MEIIGFIGAVIGLIAAILNRRRIIVVRPGQTSYEVQSTRPRMTIGKRLKRFVLALILAFGCVAIAAFVSPEPSGPVMEFMMWPFAICLLVAAYQAVAALIMIFASLWR